jgi:hypothetical protein
LPWLPAVQAVSESDRRTAPPSPIETRIPELTVQAEQIEADTEKAVTNYKAKVQCRLDDLIVPTAKSALKPDLAYRTS